MYIVNRQDLNEIFWRENEEDGWMHEDIGNLVRAYDTLWDMEDYTALLEQIITKTFAENRAPTEADMFMIDTFWDDKET